MIEDWQLVRYTGGTKEFKLMHLNCPYYSDTHSRVIRHVEGDISCLACKEKPPQEIIDTCLLGKVWPYVY